MKAFTLPVVFLCCMLVAGQTPPLEPINLADYVNRKPAGCELRTAAMDGITQKVPLNEPIIVIAHLGANETKRNLNSRRLQNVRAYWMHGVAPVAQRKSEMIILAEGERVSGYGRLEFYAGGKLVWLLNIPRNADVDFGDCVPPDDSYIMNGVYDICRIKSHRIFYPCRDRYASRKR